MASCTVYKKKVNPGNPELGVIGIYSHHLFKSDYQPKTVIPLLSPVRLKLGEISIEEKQYFKKKDSLDTIQRDVLVSLEILDEIALIQQLNTDSELLKYLKKADDYKLVTEITVRFPNAILATIKSADEIYLVQKKTSTLSIELHRGNKAFGSVDFTDGNILNFEVSEFCWGQNERREIEIFDLISDGTKCSNETFKSAKKVEKKNEFKY